MHTDPPDGQPPVGGTWPRLYAAVLLVLALAILGSWLLSRAYS